MLELDPDYQEEEQRISLVNLKALPLAHVLPVADLHLPQALGIVRKDSWSLLTVKRNMIPASFPTKRSMVRGFHPRT